jgi:hypothetical protein
MASASMPSNSGITPIFNDEDAESINDHFEKLFRIQWKNLWDSKYSYNYLTIKDLEFFNNFIGEKLLKVDKLYNNNNSKSRNIKKLSDFWILFDNTIQNYKVNILGEKKRNNIKVKKKIIIKNNIEELNNSSKTELIKIINSLINSLIQNFILNPKYFNQKNLSKTLQNKSFYIFKDDKVDELLEEIGANTYMKKQSQLMKKEGEKHLAYKQAQEEGKQKNEALVEQYVSVFGSQPIVNPVKNGGMRKLTKNKTTKNKTTKNKTTKHKTTKHKTTKHKTTKNKTTKHKTTKNKKLIVKK